MWSLMKDYEWGNPAGISTMYRFLQNPWISFLYIIFFFEDIYVKKQTNPNLQIWKKEKKNLERIIVGSQLLLFACTSLNAFIYKLALEWGITPNFTVKYSSGARTWGVFNVRSVSSYCKMR